MKEYLLSVSENAKELALKALFLTKSFWVQNQRIIFISTAVSAVILIIGLFIENNFSKIQEFYNKFSDVVKNITSNSVNKINKIIYPQKLETKKVATEMKKDFSIDEFEIIIKKLNAIQESIDQIKQQTIDINQNVFDSEIEVEDQKDILDTNAPKSSPRSNDTSQISSNYFTSEEKRRSEKKAQQENQK